MAAQQGFDYERNAAKVLKKFKIVPKGFEPAGAGSDQPDLILEHKKIRSGCELKISAASAGSLVLKYDIHNKTRPWGFGIIDLRDDEKVFIKKLAEQVRLFDRIKDEWSKIPFKREKDALWQKTAGKLTPRQRYERDLKTFPDIKGEISAEEIEKYYNKKNTYYVNVGTHGFYLLGKRNPLKLQGIPRFGDSAKATYRARVQYKGSDNYQFTFEMQFSMLQKSPYNIAPIKGKKVEILENELDLSLFGIEST